MLSREFLGARKRVVALILLLGLAAGAAEGAFVLLGKAALQGNVQVTLAAWGLFALVTGRVLAQAASATLETRAVFGWLGERRAALLHLAAGRDFPAHRSPFRQTLAAALGQGADKVAEGLLAGLRCQAALAQGIVLLPLLLLFSWRPALAALALAAPALWISRWRARSLEASARRWRESKSEADEELEDFSEGLESAAGNGLLGERSALLSDALAVNDARSRGWENARALFTPALEWFFFVALAGLFWLVGELGAAGPASLLPFAALLLLLYRPIREWARNFPAYLAGEEARRGQRSLETQLAALPIRRRAGAVPGETLMLRGVRFGYATGFTGVPARWILDDHNLELGAGELTLLAGPNGSGKSTLLKILAGVESPQGGDVSMPARAIPCAYLPQKVFVEADYRAWLAALRAERRADFERLDGTLGLSAILAKAGEGRAWAAGLSGGERQRLGLGRVFASRAGYLLLDEPTTFLAAGDRERILGDLLEFWKAANARGGLIVSHEPFLAEFCSRTVRMESAARMEGKA